MDIKIFVFSKIPLKAKIHFLEKKLSENQKEFKPQIKQLFKYRKTDKWTLLNIRLYLAPRCGGTSSFSGRRIRPLPTRRPAPG